MIERYYSPGKLMISGEYLVLKGSKSLALPTKLGQSLEFESNSSSVLKWQSFDSKGCLWFEAQFQLPHLKLIKAAPKKYLQFLWKLLKIVKSINPNFIDRASGIVQTHLEFNLDWGLGSSSTLIHNLAQWGKVNPYLLGIKSSDGSLYDIAVAQINKAIIYQKLNQARFSEVVDFDPPFKSSLYLVHLNKKQITAKEIKQFQKAITTTDDIHNVSKITQNILCCKNQKQFNELLIRHERILSSVLQSQTVQKKLFPDFTGAIKSLGAWNGDFILASGNSGTADYFITKGYSTVFNFQDIF